MVSLFITSSERIDTLILLYFARKMPSINHMMIYTRIFRILAPKNQACVEPQLLGNKRGWKTIEYSIQKIRNAQEGHEHQLILMHQVIPGFFTGWRSPQGSRDSYLLSSWFAVPVLPFTAPATNLKKISGPKNVTQYGHPKERISFQGVFYTTSPIRKCVRSPVIRTETQVPVIRS